MKVLSTAVLAVLLAAPAVNAQDLSKAAKDGGIKVSGWTGKIDAKEVKDGLKLEDARFAKEDGFKITTGPAVTYWNPANKASGNYTVKATFREEKYMSLNNHPHPYGIVIGGNNLGTDQESYVYCAAYGNGRFIMRGFGPAPFQLNARGEANDAINKAAGPGQPVTQEIAVSVHGDKVECAINGKVVGTYNKADLVTAGKLKSTDGVYGLRIGHNAEAVITGFQLIKH